MKVWEWEHNNWLEEIELEALILDKNEASPECLNLEPRLREGIVALKSFPAPDKPAVTRCRVS